VTHESGDEGDEYLAALRERAEHQGVDLRLVADRIGEERTSDSEGRRIYPLDDAYACADFITYPSLHEGFGNALIEAFYHRKPILVNRYGIFVADIEPRGFRVIAMNGFLTHDVVTRVRRVLEDDAFREEMVNQNFEFGKRFFSYGVLRRKLRSLITNVTGAEDL
jgi:glycosyltransferase involved in cell wall biosynthesis